MEKLKFYPKHIVIGMICLILADALLMVMGAILVGRGILAYDGIKIWSYISLIIAAMVSGVYCGGKTGIPLNAYVAAAFCYLVIIALPMTVWESDAAIPPAIKGAVALFCGVFIGNFFGISRHNKLRVKRKKKRLYTK